MTTARANKWIVAVGGHDPHRDDHAYADVTRLALVVVKRFADCVENLAVGS